MADKSMGGGVRSEVCPARVQSVCPACGRVAAGAYAERGDAVWFDVSCPACGGFTTLASEDPGAFFEYMDKPSVTVAPREALTKGSGAPAGACPLHCGVCEDHLMTACCVLIDVTARCDQRCPWCFAEAGEGSGAGEPSLAEIGKWYDRLIALGEDRPFNIQISGGEPAVRDDLPEIVALGRAKGFTYIQLNTNGRRLGAEDSSAYGGDVTGEAYARRLAEAGLTTVFMQFDGVTDAVYEKLRGEPLFAIKQRAIENCAKAGLPVTLVPTIVKGVNIFETGREGEIGGMVDFMLANLGVVKGIHFQPVSFFGRHPASSHDIPTHLEEAAAPHVQTQNDRPGASRHEINPDRVTMFAVMDEIERQTGGRIRKSDLLSITTGHPLCCFCANFLQEWDGSLASTATDVQRKDGMACCDDAGGFAKPSDTSCCCSPTPNPLEIIKHDRDFVLNKWVVGTRDSAAAAPAPPERDAAMSLDEAIDWLRSNMFTMSGMAFMDESNLDAERLKRCRVQYYTPDDRLIPFCAYNTMYRGAS